MGAGTSKTETGLTPFITYTRYVWAYNTCGISPAATLTGTIYQLGASYGGGIIFYIDWTTQHGLISSTSDQSTGTNWGCQGTLIGTSTGIGSGQANTTAIVNGCSTAGIAARICNDLVLNGYSDWFLPSKDEQDQMYEQKNVIGGFTSTWYWSSSETGPSTAWYQFFSNGYQYGYSKSDATFYVRAIRAF